MPNFLLYWNGVRRELAREQASDRLKELGLGKMRTVDAAIKSAPKAKPIPPFPKVEPWPEPVSGQEVAAQLEALFATHLVLPEGGAVAATLFAMFTYVADVADVSPNLGMTSIVKRCGKTTLMGLMAQAVRVSATYIEHYGCGGVP